MLDHAVLLGVRAHHEAGSVMEKEDGGVALLAELDELGGLGGTFGGDGAVVADNAATVPLDFDEATDRLVIKQKFEVQEFRAVGDAGDDFPNIIGTFGIAGYDAEQVFGRVQEIGRASCRERGEMSVGGT